MVRCEDPDGAIERDVPLVTGTVYPAPVEAKVGQVAAIAPMDDIVVISDTTIDTDTGAVGGVPSPGFTNGAFEVGKFEIAAGVTLRVRGSKPLVVRAADSVKIDGTLDLSGEAGQGARGGLGGRGGRGVAGGSDGGEGGTVTTRNSTLVSETQPAAGRGQGGGQTLRNVRDGADGGGGSFGTKGEDAAWGGGAAGPTYGTDTLDPLLGGSGGGGGAASNAGTYAGGGGGGAGGGAVRIVCRGDISVGGTIDANGGNGGPSSDAGAGGGGSGGAIHLVAAGRIAISGRVTAAGGYAPGGAGRGGDGWVRLEDSVGDFRAGKIEPAHHEGTFATSVALSRWYRVTDRQGRPAAGAYFLAILSKSAVPAGTLAAVEVEGARASAQNPAQPDLATATGFGRDPNALAGAEFVRFRLTFRSDPANGARASIDEIVVPFE